MISKGVERIKNRITQDLLNINYNARVIAMTLIPMVLIMAMGNTYHTLYLDAIGLSKQQIGGVLFLRFLFLIVSTLFSVGVVERIGRRNSLLIGDLLSWATYFFLIGLIPHIYAVIIGSICWGIGQGLALIAWYCLLIEDAQDQEEISRIYTVNSFIFINSSILVPLAGVVIAYLGMEKGGRIIMIATGLMNYLMYGIRHKFLLESKIGHSIKVKRPSIKPNVILKKTVQDLFQIRENKLILIALLLAGSSSLSKIVVDNFYYLYCVEKMAVHRAIISIFQFTSSMVYSLLTLFFIPSFVKMIKSNEVRILFFAGVSLIGIGGLFFVKPGEWKIMILFTVLIVVGESLIDVYCHSIWNGIIPVGKTASHFAAFSLLTATFNAVFSLNTGILFEKFSFIIPLLMAGIISVIIFLVFIKIVVERRRPSVIIPGV